LLRYFLASHGVRMPDARRLAEALRQGIGAKSDARVCIDLGSHTLRRHRGALHVVAELAKLPLEVVSSWRGESRVVLPGVGAIDMWRRRGAGIDLDRLLAQPVTVCLRQGGEKLQPDAARPRRPVKDLLQVAGVPPWQRERLPFLWSGTRLVWVAGVGIDCAFRAEKGRPGVVPRWCASLPMAVPA
jgi:tRNA(Ile)-lysidine synthase